MRATAPPGAERPAPDLAGRAALSPAAPRKVLFVLEDLMVGGAQRHSLGLVQALRGRFDLRVLGLSAGVAASVITPELEPQTRVLGLKGMAKPATWRHLAKVLDEESPDLIVTVNQIATFAVQAALIFARKRPPVAVVFHSTDVKNLAGWIRTTPFFLAVWMSSAIVYISANQQALWLKRGLRARRVELIRNGIDLSNIAPPTPEARAAARLRLGLSDADYVIGLTAVFRYEKNHQQLVHAVAQLRHEGVPARALLVGDGPKRAEIEQLAKDLDVAEAVIFAGMQADVRPYLAAMDVGVICSTSIETLSLSALEGMASGLPMIMSQIGGASEIVTPDRNGYLFPAGDTSAFVDRLRRCAAPEVRERLGREALRTVREHFSYADMVDRYAALFAALCDAQHSEPSTS